MTYRIGEHIKPPYFEGVYIQYSDVPVKTHNPFDTPEWIETNYDMVKNMRGGGINY